MYLISLLIILYNQTSPLFLSIKSPTIYSIGNFSKNILLKRETGIKGRSLKSRFAGNMGTDLPKFFAFYGERGNTKYFKLFNDSIT